MPTRRKNVAQLGALVVGVFYLAIGVLGFFITGFHSFVEVSGESILTFTVNPFHNIVHIGIGVGLLGVSLTSNPAISEGALIGGGLVYILAAFLGFVNALQILSITSPVSIDNFFHLISGVAALLLGAIGTLQTRGRVQDAPPDDFPVPRALGRG